jgi:hypothetical protein
MRVLAWAIVWTPWTAVAIPWRAIAIPWRAIAGGSSPASAIIAATRAAAVAATVLSTVSAIASAPEGAAATARGQGLAIGPGLGNDDVAIFAEAAAEGCDALGLEEETVHDAPVDGAHRLELVLAVTRLNAFDSLA